MQTEDRTCAVTFFTQIYPEASALTLMESYFCLDGHENYDNRRLDRNKYHFKQESNTTIDDQFTRHQSPLRISLDGTSKERHRFTMIMTWGSNQLS